MWVYTQQTVRKKGRVRNFNVTYLTHFRSCRLRLSLKKSELMCRFGN